MLLTVSSSWCAQILARQLEQVDCCHSSQCEPPTISMSHWKGPQTHSCRCIEIGGKPSAWSFTPHSFAGHTATPVKNLGQAGKACLPFKSRPLSRRTFQPALV